MLAFAKKQRAQTEIDRRRRDIKTYMDPLDRSQSDLKDFLSDFNSNILSKRQVEMQQIFLEYPAVQGFYRELVPNVIDHEDFWQRYYYRTDSVDRVLKDMEMQDVAKLRSRSESVKTSWSEVTSSNVHGVLNQYSTNLSSLRKLTPTRSRSKQTDYSTSPWNVAANNSTNVENTPTATRNTATTNNSRSLKNKHSVAKTISTMKEQQTPAASKEKDEPLLVKWSRSLNGKEFTAPSAPIPVATETRIDTVVETKMTICAEDRSEDSLPEAATEKSSFEKELTPLETKIVEPEDASGVVREEFFMSPSATSTVEDDVLEEDVPPAEGVETTSAASTTSMLPIVLAICVLICGMLTEVQMSQPTWWVPVQDGVCGPVLPWGQFLSSSNSHVHREAPWWAPSGWKQEAFALTCGPDRVRAVWTWEESRKGVYGLTISDADNSRKRLVKKSGLESVNVSPNEIVLHQGRNKVSSVAVPWKLDSVSL